MSEVRFTDQHEWVRVDGDEATIGITKYAAEQLGDVVFVELPEAGRGRAGLRRGGRWVRARATGSRRHCLKGPTVTATSQILSFAVVKHQRKM